MNFGRGHRDETVSSHARTQRTGSMMSRPFVVLYSSQLVAAMGISMVSPLLPVYAEELGATGIWIGLTFSIFALTQMITSPFIGRWSDRFGRKPFIVAGLLLYFVAAIGYMIATELWHVLAFRAISGGGTSMIFSVARAYLGVMVPPGEEGRWSGVFATADIVGFGIGPLLAGITRELFGFDAVFSGMALLMGSGAALVWLLLPRYPRRSDGSDEADEPQSPIGVAIRDRMVLGLTLNWGLVALSFGSTLAFLGVRLERLDVNAGLIGLIFALQAASSGVSQPFLGRVADRVERRLLNAAGLSALSLLVVSLGLTERPVVVGLLMLGVGAASGLAAVATHAMQVEAGRRHGMGAVIGLGSAGNAAGVLLGSILGGIMVDITGRDEAAFFSAGAMIVLGLLVVSWLMRGRPQVGSVWKMSTRRMLEEPGVPTSG